MIFIIALVCCCLLVIASAFLVLKLKETDNPGTFMKIIAWGGMTLGMILIIVSICVGIFTAMHKHHKGRHGGRHGNSYEHHGGKKHGKHGKGKRGHGKHGRKKKCKAECCKTKGDKDGVSMENGEGVKHFEWTTNDGETRITREIRILNGDTVVNEQNIEVEVEG